MTDKSAIIVIMEVQSTTLYKPNYTINQNSKTDKEGILKEAGSKEIVGSEKKEFDPNLEKLKTADARVRAHEAAHLAAGAGVVTGGASFTYERGSDGRMYAVGGEVPIDAGKASSPEATVQKARQIVAAAMAPADPSPQDYRVAASAIIMEMQAKTEVMREAQDKLKAGEAYIKSTSNEDETQPLDKMDDIF